MENTIGLVSATSGVLGAAAAKNKINNPKYASLQPVENGYIVKLAKTDSYGETTHVAIALDAAYELITNYLNA